MIKKDILKRLENFPDDAEVRISPDWANDFGYMPIKVIGYIKEFKMIIIEPKYDDKKDSCNYEISETIHQK